MAVYTLEDDTLSVKVHQAVFQFKGAESNLCFRCFNDSTAGDNFSGKNVKVRFFRTPRPHARNSCSDIGFIALINLISVYICKRKFYGVIAFADNIELC